jgi:hypothetical protein
LLVEEFQTKFAQGVVRASDEFWGWPQPDHSNRKAHDALQNLSSKHHQQTNIKQINRLARHQRHHPVALDAQISQDKYKTERPVNRAFLLNETQEQNS